MNNEVLINAEGVSKKFCRDLKRSLWYGMKDIASEMTGRTVNHDDLRKDEFWAVRDVSLPDRQACLPDRQACLPDRQALSFELQNV